MDLVAKWPADRRRALFEETAAHLNLRAVLIEKDFWVCWALARLFSLDGHTSLVFKGGTALSKVYGAIKRFSEDIDLSFDRSVFELDEAVAQANTVTQKDNILDEIDERAKAYLAGKLHPAFERAIRDELGQGDWTLKVQKGSSRHWDYLDFSYPLSLAKEDYGFAEYNTPIVRIELVARGEHWPEQPGLVRPYAADAFPHLFTKREANVHALAVERTFWEKATLLHREYHVADTKEPKPGLTRHYSDLAVLADTVHGQAALGRIDLLTTVAEHKAVYFREPAARYDTARPGTLRLVPPESRLKGLRSDYAKMQSMFFDAPLSFDAVMERIQTLESQINATAAAAEAAAGDDHNDDVNQDTAT